MNPSMASILRQIHEHADQLDGECLEQFGFALVTIGASICNGVNGSDSTARMLRSMAEHARAAELEGWEEFDE